MNDIYLPCLCGSGKKFKFCCYEIQKKGSIIPANSEYRSKDVLAVPMSLGCGIKGDEIAIEVDKQFERALEQYANAKVTCLGNVHHAETAHHHTPLLLRSCRVVLNKSP
jgi:hypothetical protein